MNINLIIKEKPTELDKHLNQEDMEVSPFEFALLELEQYVNGYINISFENKANIVLDLFYDFLVCFDCIIRSINATKFAHSKKKKYGFVSKVLIFICFMKLKMK